MQRGPLRTPEPLSSYSPLDPEFAPGQAHVVLRGVRAAGIEEASGSGRHTAEACGEAAAGELIDADAAGVVADIQRRVGDGVRAAALRRCHAG